METINMKNLFLTAVILLVILVAGCSNPTGSDSSQTDSARTAGYSVTHSADGLNFNMNYVPGGKTFIMGEDVVDDDEAHSVTLTKSYWMAETEVTQGLWEAVMGTTWPGTAPSLTNGLGGDYPAYYVNWFDAVAFCNALTLADSSINDSQVVFYSDEDLVTPYSSGSSVYADFNKTGYRLPTEAEWEYAARWIDGNSWNGGNHASGDESDSVYLSNALSDYVWYSANSNSSTQIVGSKIANALILYDMNGNIQELCYDWYEYSYSGSAETDPVGPTSGSMRASRGGNWNNPVNSMRCANHLGYSNPYTRSEYVGFRPCRTAN